MLIKILIIFFTFLIGYQLFLAVFSFTKIDNLVEGLENNSRNEYKPYNINDPNNTLILAQQNAGNIEFIKGRIDGLDGVKTKVDTMQQNIISMQTQIDALVQQQANYANDLAGSEPLTITGINEAE
jgi:hypothetical protein